MADATKSINGMTDLNLKSLFSVFKTRKTMTFLYGFMFAFVLFTVFLAFIPSSNSTTPISFSNIFTSANDSYRSHFSSIFSYFLPTNTSSPPPPPHVNTTTTTTTRSNNTFSQPPTSQNLTQIVGKPKPVLNSNQTSSIVVNNQTQTNNAPSSEASQSPPPKPSLVANQSATSGSLVNDGGKKGMLPSNGTHSVAVLVKPGVDNFTEALMNCDLFDGEWVKDDTYPLYKPGSCSFIDEQFNCVNNGRPDSHYQRQKWKPKACTLPRLNGGHMLELLRGKRLVFVGDSLNRNMWESLVCILRNSAKDQSKVFEAHGRNHFRGEASYSFIFKDYNFSVEFFVSPFLVQEWEMPEKDGSKKETLRLDLVGRSSDQYKDADIIIFNTGHWWTHDKTAKGKDYYQEGSHVYGELNVLEAFRKALTTWARWVDANVNQKKSMVFFRGYSASHFSGGQWNSGGACDSETEPIRNETYLSEYPPKMKVLELVLKGMKNHVTYLNITRLTDYRKDGHPSVYRKQNLSDEERKSPLRFQDCSHWCLPGVPDSWNELFYAELLIKETKMMQHQNQKRHR